MTNFDAMYFDIREIMRELKNFRKENININTENLKQIELIKKELRKINKREKKGEELCKHENMFNNCLILKEKCDKKDCGSFKSRHPKEYKKIEELGG